MGFKLERVHVWACEVPDQVGGTAAKLAPLAEAGANLEYIFTKRLLNKQGIGILFVAPITGPAQVKAARSIGMSESHETVVLRVEGDNQAGLAFKLTQQWAVAGISLQGLTMSVLGQRFVGFAAFDSVTDANRAAQILADLTAHA